MTGIRSWFTHRYVCLQVEPLAVRLPEIATRDEFASQGNEEKEVHQELEQPSLRLLDHVQAVQPFRHELSSHRAPSSFPPLIVESFLFLAIFLVYVGIEPRPPSRYPGSGYDRDTSEFT